MKITFKQVHLQELYEFEKTKNKKYRYQPQVVRKYVDKINILRSVTRIEDLFIIRSLHYEALSGANGRQSIRVDNRYRIEFYTTQEGDEPNVITICCIAELSNHYQ